MAVVCQNIVFSYACSSRILSYLCMAVLACRADDVLHRGRRDVAHRILADLVLLRVILNLSSN